MGIIRFTKGNIVVENFPKAGIFFLIDFKNKPKNSWEFIIHLIENMSFDLTVVWKRELLQLIGQIDYIKDLA